MTNPKRNCFICGSPGEAAYAAKIDQTQITEHTYSSRKRPELMHHAYHECASCKLLFVPSLPDRSELLSEYERASFQASVESMCAARTYLDTLIPRLSRPPFSVLDVGCGDGEFLLACRQLGVERLQGIEPSPAASSAARLGIGDVILSGGYENKQFHEKFDLITLFQTIEHIDDPLNFFRWARESGRAGGHVAVACHDYRSLANRVLRERSPIFDIEHLQIFTARSISLAMQTAGLKVVHVGQYVNTYPVSYWTRLAPVPLRIKESRVFTTGPVADIRVTLPIGNIMAVGRIEDH